MHSIVLLKCQQFRLGTDLAWSAGELTKQASETASTCKMDQAAARQGDWTGAGLTKDKVIRGGVKVDPLDCGIVEYSRHALVLVETPHIPTYSTGRHQVDCLRMACCPVSS